MSDCINRVVSNPSRKIVTNPTPRSAETFPTPLLLTRRLCSARAGARSIPSRSVLVKNPIGDDEQRTPTATTEIRPPPRLRRNGKVPVKACAKPQRSLRWTPNASHAPAPIRLRIPAFSAPRSPANRAARITTASKPSLATMKIAPITAAVGERPTLTRAVHSSRASSAR